MEKPINPSDLKGRLENLRMRYEDDHESFNHFSEILIWEVLRDLGYGEVIDWLGKQERW